MAGIIVADTIQSGGDFIRLNSASQTVATINARGIYANTGNLLIASNGTIGVASITNTAITGTMTQAQIGNGVAGTGPAFASYIGSNQTVSNATLTKLNFNIENFDTANCYNNSTYRFTPNVAGYYYISLFFGFAGEGGTKTGVNMPYLKHSTDGDIQLGRYYYSSDYPSGAGSIILYFNGTTDWVEPYISQSTGGNGLIQGGIQFSRFSGALLRAA